jgi:Predicted nucleotide kinase
MPLILITGIPSSGKSTRALQIKSFFEDKHEKTVHIVSENDIIASCETEKNVIFLGKSVLVLCHFITFT